MSLSSIEGYKLGADLEDVYQDFYNLGRIFQVEDKAEEIVSGMKGKITAAEEAVAGQEAIPVFVFDMAQEEGAYTCGNNFTSKLIEHAGGVNIFNDLDTTWATGELGNRGGAGPRGDHHRRLRRYLSGGEGCPAQGEPALATVPPSRTTALSP